MRTHKAVDFFTAETQRAEKFGYEFIGWNDLPDGSGAYYEKLYDLQVGVKVTRPAQGISMGQRSRICRRSDAFESYSVACRNVGEKYHGFQ